MQRKAVSLITVLLSVLRAVNGQSVVAEDSLLLATIELENVVVTGQYAPQSTKNSVYNVQSIESARIQNQSATSLPEVLGLETNIRFNRDNATATSGINLLGLSGKYVKVLIDGVPMTGRSGVNNEIDIDQINVNHIERVEIVEGPMSVNYGSDALAGVVNVITKNNRPETLWLDFEIHEESIGDEFSLFESGLHQISASLGHQLSDRISVSMNSRSLKNGGWEGNLQNQRGKDWYPKDQLFLGGKIDYSNQSFSLYYQLDYMDQSILNESSFVNNQNPLRDPTAIDEEHLSSRWMHQIQSEWMLKNGAAWHSVVSYTDYNRITHEFMKNLVTGGETTTAWVNQDTTYFRTLFFRNTLSNLEIIDGRGLAINAQMGFDANKEHGRGTTMSDGEKSMIDVGLFGSAEFSLFKSLKIRPGFRFIYNSFYNTAPVGSVNSIWHINPKWQLRASYARGYRAPALKELFYEFIDSNHNIIGNEDLKAEDSHNFSASTSCQVSKSISLDGKFFYNHINNQITFFTDAQDPTAPTTLINLLQYKTTGSIVEADFNRNGLKFSLGWSYIGQYQRLSEDENHNIPRFLFSSSLSSTISYTIPKVSLDLSAFYKYTGPLEQYRNFTDDETGETIPYLTQVNGFHWLNLTLSKTLKSFKISAGSKNILNVTYVNNSDPGGVHGGTSGSSPVGTGRSFFLKLNYHFSK